MPDLFSNENTIFWPRKRGLRKILGDLELAVMERFWAHPRGARLSIRTVFDSVGKARGVRYTTIMNTVQRLADKGALEADRSVVPNLYAAPLDREEFLRATLGQLLDGLLDDFAEPAIAHAPGAGEPEGKKAAVALLDWITQQRKSRG